ncbi:ATP-binding protein, partial [Halolamina salina]
MELPFTTDVNAWTWDTVTSLSQHSENQYLEYKETLHPPDEIKPVQKEWQRKLEKEITAFAN